ncbi:hypothetical protein N7G274_000192 [Stereocaulon virgatum]|uniref:Uncharacterized protein n=1 Tax=Stereocaulon virgatum TaxID=373712 RepID=A0ABR4ARV0_9LECA
MACAILKQKNGAGTLVRCRRACVKEPGPCLRASLTQLAAFWDPDSKLVPLPITNPRNEGLRWRSNYTAFSRRKRAGLLIVKEKKGPYESHAGIHTMENRKSQLRHIPQAEQVLLLCRISSLAEILFSRGHVDLVDEKHATAQISWLSSTGCGT